MPRVNKKTVLIFLGVFLAAWLGMKYLLPLLFPFLLGTLLALSAEPIAGLLSRRLPRAAAAAIGVTTTLLLLTSVLLLLGAALVRELGLLANALPDLGQTARSGLGSLESFLLELTWRMPEGVQPLLSQAVIGLFSSGSSIVDQLVQQLPGVASRLLGRLPRSALALGTGILSGFMVSARLPRLKQWFFQRLPQGPLARYLPALKQVRTALLGWLKAQLKLAGMTLGILLAGFLLLRIPYAPIWATLIALVDAIPVLGTGTVLLPWSLICLLQGEDVKAVGLLGIYATAMIARSVLEPRLVGKQLGLDPLLTLAALYTGYRIWGIGGMFLSPLICVAALEFARAKPA